MPDLRFGRRQPELLLGAERLAVVGKAATASLTVKVGGAPAARVRTSAIRVLLARL